MENAIYKILEDHKATLTKIDSEVIVDVKDVMCFDLIREFIGLGLDIDKIKLTQNTGKFTFGLKQIFEVNNLDIEKLCKNTK